MVPKNQLSWNCMSSLPLPSSLFVSHFLLLFSIPFYPLRSIFITSHISVCSPNGKLLLVEGSHVLIPLPKIGAIVTFSFDYQARSNLPRNARIVRVRNDVAWDDVIRNSLREKVLYGMRKEITSGAKGGWGGSDRAKIWREGRDAKR